jgi:hypothetical protein
VEGSKNTNLNSFDVDSDDDDKTNINLNFSSDDDGNIEIEEIFTEGQLKKLFDILNNQCFLRQDHPPFEP